MSMSGNRDRQEAGIERRGYGFAFLIAFLIFSIVGLASVAAYMFSMRALGWESSRAPGLSIPIGQVFSAQKKVVYLYVNADTSRYLSSVGGNYEVLLKPWRNFFVQEKVPFEEISKLDSIDNPNFAVLVLPSAIALNEQDRRAILEFRNRGGSILSTSTLGARDGAGQWKGYDFVRELFGVDVTGEVPPENEERHLNLFGDLPFVQSYGVAERIWLGKMGPNPLRLQGGKTAGIITNWARASTGSGQDAAAVLYDEFGVDRNHARWVMLSFSETTWEIQRNAVHGLLSNAIGWLERVPSVYAATWPSPYRAAQVIEMDTEEGFPNAQRFAAMMERINAPATFYCLTQVALQYPDIVRQIGQRHEIAYHGDTHVGFAGQPEASQAKRIDSMQAGMKSILVDTSRVTGFRAPMESYDKVTEDLLRQKGIRHHAADPNRTNARTPLFYPDTNGMHDQALVVLPRTQLDDINLLRAGTDETAISAKLVADFNQVMQMGALGLLSIHSQNFAESSPLASAFPTFLDYVSKHRDKVWIAPAGQVAQWWRDRERLSYKVNATVAKTDIDVTISGKDPAGPVSLIVNHPQSGTILQVRPVKSNTALPAVQEVDKLRSALVFSNMRPGTYSYSITFAAGAPQ